MSDAIERLKGKLASLPLQERADLAHFLIDTLDQGSTADVETAWDAELERRVAEIKSGQIVGKPADQVFAELRGRS